MLVVVSHLCTHLAVFNSSFKTSVPNNHVHLEICYYLAILGNYVVQT